MRLTAALERALWSGMLVGALLTALLCARNGLARAQRPLTFGLVLGAYLTAAALAAALLVAACLWLAGRLAGRAGIAELLAPLASGAGLWAMCSNPRALRLLFGLGEAWRFRALLPLAAIAAALGLIALALAPWRKKAAWPLRVARALGSLALVALVASLAPARAKAPGSPRPDVARGPRPSALPPLLVVGLDGADWRFIDALAARGELPHLAELRRRGAGGPLETLTPTLSPIVWTTLVTGRPPARHGIEGFTTPRLRGVEGSLPGLHPLRGVGFQRLWRWLEQSGRIRQAPVTSRDRRVPAFWNLGGIAGAPVAVVHWWATWPAEPVYGFVVSERAYAHAQARGRAAPESALTFPPELYRQIEPEVRRYDTVTPAEARAFLDLPDAQLVAAWRHGRGHPADVVRELPYFLSLFESARLHALGLVERGRRTFQVVPDLLVLFRLIDQVCHTALRHSELAGEHPESTPDAQRAFGRAVSEAYRRADAALGELLASCGGGCNVVVLSDHGFELEDFPGGLRRYHHRSAPPGIFLAAGPAFMAGRAEGLSVYDVMPLLAWLKGLPLARDLQGRLPAELLRPELLAAQPPRSVDSYGSRASAGDLAAGSEAVDDEMLERLRALGYVQ